MGYEGKIRGTPPTPLTRVPHRARELLPEQARAIVDDATDYELAVVKANTPVSHPISAVGSIQVKIDDDGIHLREEIHRTVTVEHDHVYSASVGSDKDYAPFVEEGTGLYGPKHAKYLIVPHNPEGVLAWPGADGKTHFAKFVWHPGSPGQHMFLYGRRMLEESMSMIRARGDTIMREGMR